FFSLPPGTNTLIWQYATTNRLNVVQGSNSAWVDQVLFNPTNPPPPVIVYSFTNLFLTAGDTCHPPIPDLTGANYILVLDNCSSVSLTQSPPAGTLLSLGVTTVVLSAFDTSGSVTRCTNMVSVADITPPAIPWTFTNLLLSAGTNCQASLP